MFLFPRGLSAGCVQALKHQQIYPDLGAILGRMQETGCSARHLPMQFNRGGSLLQGVLQALCGLFAGWFQTHWRLPEGSKTTQNGNPAYDAAGRKKTLLQTESQTVAVT